MAKSKYLDVNKEQYLNALFLDLEKSAKMVSFDNRAQMIHDFVIGNPSNDEPDTRISNGLTIIDGRVLIASRKVKKKKK